MIARFIFDPKNTVIYSVFRKVKNTVFLSVLAIITLRWNVQREVRASIGAYGGGNGAYERVFIEEMCF